MKKLIVVSLIILFAFVISLAAYAQEKKGDTKAKVEKQLKEANQKAEEKVEKVDDKVDDKKPVNTICPVSAESIDDPVLVTYKEKTYALCCKSCLKKFNKNPEKYISKLSEDGKSLKKIN